MQEELTKMFNQNMNFSPQQIHSSVESALDPAPVNYSITQHYHHSAHLVTNDAAVDLPQTSAPPPALPGALDVKTVLARHGVDASRFLPTQLTLFEQAAPDQQARLVELWRISPPEYMDMGAQDLVDELGAWQQTTLEQEEEMARLRYQRKTAQESTRVELTNKDEHHSVEPYISSGYELLAQRDYNQQLNAGPGITAALSGHNYSLATDPAFQSKGWWEVNPAQPMEHQYGMFDLMNQFRVPMQKAGGTYHQEDEEML